MLRWLQDHLLDPSGLDRVGDQFFEGIFPPDDVDPLACELLNDPADPTTTLADTNADGVNTRLTALQGQLDAGPALPGNRFDLD